MTALPAQRHLGAGHLFGGKFKLAVWTAPGVLRAEVGAITFEFLARGPPSATAAFPTAVEGGAARNS